MDSKVNPPGQYVPHPAGDYVRKAEDFAHEALGELDRVAHAIAGGQLGGPAAWIQSVIKHTHDAVAAAHEKVDVLAAKLDEMQAQLEELSGPRVKPKEQGSH